MNDTIRKCVGVVDGGMLLMEDDEMLVLARVRVPRLGLPGGAVLRMLLQREAQDQAVRVRPVGRDGAGRDGVGRDSAGGVVAEAWVGERNLNDYIIACVRERGYDAD